MDSGAVGIFQGRGSWTAKEEVRLLDAIEQFGFGNWEDISKHIETRTPEEAKDEYISRFLEGSIGRATWGGVEPPIKPAVCPARDEGPLGPEAVARLPPLATTTEEAAQLGYMPKRDDFEREHDHEAEQIISSLALNPDDDDLDIALKLSQVDIYTRRLRERTRRKRLVRDYQLVSVFYNNVKNRGKPLTKMAKEKKDFLDKLRPLTRFSSQAEHTAVASSLWRERELRLRLSELVRYRRNGITSSEECSHFERHAAANAGATNSHPVNARAAAVLARMAGSSGCTPQQTPSQRDLSPTHQPSQRKRESEGASSSTSPRSTRDASTVCGCCRRRSCCNSNNTNSSCNANAHLLTSNEVELCNSLNLPPLQYITMKTVLLRGNNGSKAHSQSSTPDSMYLKSEAIECNSSTTIEAVITKYLQANGWINSS
ncbi:transcriptional adapter 2B isoform X3 [Arctopsyche grandis]